MNDLISLIVPVYNVEKYINKCVDSILSQTYKDIEIILVDDGSTDNSGKICDNYSKLDRRVKVIHKKNGGLSDARNVGIEKSLGQYITFVDGDDFVTKDYVETLYKLLINTESDISIAINNLYYENDKVKHIYKHTNKNIIVADNFSMLEKMFYQKLFDTSAWGKLYKRELWNNIQFPKGKLYEDIDTIYKIFLKAKKIAYIDKEIYYYFQRDNSIVGSPFKEDDMYLIDSVENTLKIIEQIDFENKLNKKLYNSCISRFLSVNFYILRRTKLLEKYDTYNNRCISNIKKYKIIYNPHGFSFLMSNTSFIKRIFYWLVEKIASYRQCTIVGCSKGEYEEALRLTKNALCINNGIDTSIIDESIKKVKKRNTDFSNLRICTCGRIGHQKDPLFFNEIAIAYPDYKFTWIGDGELKDKLTSSNIYITGWKKRNEAIEIVNENDVFILTSLWEGLPISLLEAMYMGKLCVVTDCIGNRDVINNKVNGIIINKQNYKNCLDGINKKEYERLSKNAQMDILNNYNITKMIKEYKKIYG